MQFPGMAPMQVPPMSDQGLGPMGMQILQAALKQGKPGIMQAMNPGGGVGLNNMGPLGMLMKKLMPQQQPSPALQQTPGDALGAGGAPGATDAPIGGMGGMDFGGNFGGGVPMFGGGG